MIWLGVVAIPEKAFWDLTLYRYWMWQGLEQGHWPVLSGEWVYPAGAIVPMLAAAVGGTGTGSGYMVAWSLMITLLDAVAVLVLLHAPVLARSAPPQTGDDEPGAEVPIGPRLGAWCWIAFLLLLGPVAMGRLDAVVAPLVVVGLVLALRSPRTSAALLAFGTWVKVSPGPLLLPQVLAVRRPGGTSSCPPPWCRRWSAAWSCSAVAGSTCCRSSVSRTAGGWRSRPSAVPPG